jgi:ketosteroid isomerase-like protein
MAGTEWIYELVAAIEARDGERAATYLAEDVVYEVPAAGIRVSGRPAVAMAFSVGSAKFSSEERLEVAAAVSDGTVFAVQWRDSGVRRSDGSRFDFCGASIGQLQDGLVVSMRDFFDPAQLGG